MDTCGTCAFMEKVSPLFYRCIKKREIKHGIAETKPHYNACDLYINKKAYDTPFFKSDVFY